MRIPKPRRRWIVLLTILFVVVGLVVGSILGSDRAVWIFYYRVVDQQTLVIGAETDNTSWTRVTSVVETATTVTITVRGLEAPIRNGAGTGQGIEFIVKLRDPIGSRTVVDGSSGQVVDFTRCLQPVPLRQRCR